MIKSLLRGNPSSKLKIVGPGIFFALIGWSAGYLVPLTYASLSLFAFTLVLTLALIRLAPSNLNLVAAVSSLSLTFTFSFHMYIKYQLHFHNIDMLDVLHPTLFTFYNNLRSGVLPIWLNLSGWGHPYIVWAHYPLSLFSPLFVLLGYNAISLDIYLFSAFIIYIVATTLLGKRLGLPILTCLSWSIASLSLRFNGWYMFHVVHINSIIFAPFIYLSIRRFIEDRSIWSFSLICLSLTGSLTGSKVELWPFSIFLFIYTWVDAIHFGPIVEQKSRKLNYVFCTASLILSLFVIAFPANLIIDAINASSRLNFGSGISSLHSLDFYSRLLWMNLDSPITQALGIAIFYALIQHKIKSAGFAVFILTIIQFLWMQFGHYFTLTHIELLTLATLSGTSILINGQVHETSFWGRALKSSFVLILPLFLFEAHGFYPKYYFGLIPIVLVGVFSRSLTPNLRYFLIGFILVNLCRYNLQYLFIKVTGAIWHPIRDDFLLYFFLAPFGIHGLSTLSTRLNNFMKRGFYFHFPEQVQVPIAIFVLANGLLFHFAYIAPGNGQTFIKPNNPGLESFFTPERVSQGRVLALPDQRSYRDDQWTASFVFNPNILQYYGIMQASFYDSTPNRYLSNLINKINLRKHFTYDNPSIQHAFPWYVLRCFDKDQLGRSEHELYQDYSYIRLIPQTLNLRFLATSNVKWILTESKIDGPDYAYLDQSPFSLPRDKLKLVSDFDFKEIRETVRNAPVRRYYIYEVPSTSLAYAYKVPNDQFVEQSLPECVEQLSWMDPKRPPYVITDAQRSDTLRDHQTGVNSYFPVEARLNVNSTEVDVPADHTGWVFLSQAYSGSWKAMAGKQELTIAPANCGLSAIRVPKGAHKIEMQYQPAHIELSKWLSLFGIAVVILLFGTGLYFLFWETR